MDTHDSVLVGCELSKLLRSAAVNVARRSDGREGIYVPVGDVYDRRAQSDTAWLHPQGSTGVLRARKETDMGGNICCARSELLKGLCSS